MHAERERNAISQRWRGKWRPFSLSSCTEIGDAGYGGSTSREREIMHCFLIKNERLRFRTLGETHWSNLTHCSRLERMRTARSAFVDGR